MVKRALNIHPSVWRADQLQDKSAISFELDARHIAAFEQALRSVEEKDIPLEAITQEDFPLNDIADDVQHWENEIQNGKGLLTLTGLPIERYSKTQCATIYWGLSSYFGAPQSQSLEGDLLGHVVGVGGKDTRERAYRNSTELALHTDASDIVGMMCLVKAKKGGLSGYSSGPAVYNEMLSKHPELLEVLFEGFQYHRFGEHSPGESPVTEHKIPVFSEVNGLISISYLRMYIELAYLEMGVEKSQAEQQALDTLDDIAHSPAFRFNFMMEPGDIVYFNNYTVLHTRTEFFDHDDPDKRRHLLRLWLKAHRPRPVHKYIEAFTDREGIKPQEGKKSFYAGSYNYKENIPHSEHLND